MKFAPELDFTDVLASSFGNLVLRGFVLGGAVWTGLLAGELSVVAGGLADGHVRSPLLSLLSHPYEATLLWAVPGALSLGAVWLRFGRMESSGTIPWGILTGCIALGRVASEVKRLDAWLPITVAWVSCLVLIGMIGTALWFLRQWQINRWANEMALLKAENAARRAELSEKFGTDNPGPEPLDAE